MPSPSLGSVLECLEINPVYELVLSRGDVHDAGFSLSRSSGRPQKDREEQLREIIMACENPGS